MAPPFPAAHAVLIRRVAVSLHHSVDQWAAAAGLSSGPVLRRFRKGGFLV
jgi:hypothetical protein